MSSRRSLVEIQEKIVHKEKLPAKKSVTIYEDKLLNKENNFGDKGKGMVQCSLDTIGCQTDVLPCDCNCHLIANHGEEVDTNDEAYRLMIQEEVPPEYWKILAERRREALNDSLKENEELHTEIILLKEENLKLREVAEQVEYFASILKELSEDPDDSGIQERSEEILEKSVKEEK